MKRPAYPGIRPLWHYFRAGHVERGARYEWRDGYSRVVPVAGQTTMIYPWLTRQEAQTAAKSGGGKAIFHETREAADRAVNHDVARARIIAAAGARP